MPALAACFEGNSLACLKPRFQSPNNYKPLVVGIGLLCVAVLVGMTRDKWLPMIRGEKVDSSHLTATSAAEDAHAHEEAHEDEHNHDHAGHDEATSIELSANGLKNIGFEPFEVASERF